MKYTVAILILVSLLLAACSTPAAQPASLPTPVVATISTTPESTCGSEANSTHEDESSSICSAQPAEESTAEPETEMTPLDQPLLDEQGAVVVEVTPANLSNPAETLDFTVAMNTHSVNLGMDLAQLSTLTTDTGVSVGAKTWGGMQGGHHVSGTLSFPASVNGQFVLAGAKLITLSIQNLDAPERTFTWTINSSSN